MAWSMTRRVERQATRLHDMMERLGVDGAALARLHQGQAYADARTRCLDCVSSDACVRLLDSNSEPDNPPEFCPTRRLLSLSFPVHVSAGFSGLRYLLQPSRQEVQRKGKAVHLSEERDKEGTQGAERPPVAGSLRLEEGEGEEHKDHRIDQHQAP